MIAAGMDIARLNFSHGSLEEHKFLIEEIREAAREMNKPVAILQDLPGLKLRIGDLGVEGIEVKKGETVILSPRAFIDKAFKVLPVALDGLEKVVTVGTRILIADGIMELGVVAIKKHDIYCKVHNAGTIHSRKGINIPNLVGNFSAVTQSDMEKLQFGLKQGVDFVALSFIRSRADVMAFRRLLEKWEGAGVHHPTKIIVKIEKPEAVRDFDEILEVADAIMVARGDLGVESPIETLPMVQKELIHRCLLASKPVITATQMLLSMVDNPRPTRSEVSDVANAVIDHTDAVMLSEETARGKYPVETVQMMAKIIEQAEASPYSTLDAFSVLQKGEKIDTPIAYTACDLAHQTGAEAILVASLSGETAHLISKFRPNARIIVATHSDKVKRQLMLSWGVTPLQMPVCRTIDELIRRCMLAIKHQKLAEDGARIIVVAGQPVGAPGNVNMVKIHTL